MRAYPHVAGIDFAGTVRDSLDHRHKRGDRVVLTGWRVGETHWGGYSQRTRVTADWLVPLPNRLSTRDALTVGTAGLTAMLAIGRLETLGLNTEGGEVLVTGAAGGVASIAIALLARFGYQAVALSGRSEHSEALKKLGATAIVAREEFLAQSDKPLEPARWAAVIDNVGGKILGKILRQVKYGGAIAAVGNAAGIDLETNVLPFILRGVTLNGIDSVMQPYAARIAAWDRIAENFDLAAYGGPVGEVGLPNCPKRQTAFSQDRCGAGSSSTGVRQRRTLTARDFLSASSHQGPHIRWA
ncbi:acrylyl-CoA reductase family protein [Sinorhizobium prairiense]|uniref:acrylyl-CoA reductase family protein n=1 Tax=unclassified Sinorhizobium TaxID=2613772 RepID=UPI0023D7FFD0|nr:MULTISPECIES: acryloyl-CoA reductase [unclassified Sinorhizobium]WEJ12970.1 acryloyl-CoA reductase [Sinorhizobium sp. M103]WEJ18056.1 acryloyl-CoA reductase [Sinorhizobium sp. K101]WEJ39999.1 acryloyl-CoA reductase [Sinorhizobium sp. C101]